MFISLSDLPTTLMLKKLQSGATTPTLLEGRYGSGRYHYILQFLREKECTKEYRPLSTAHQDPSLPYKGKCNCTSCVKLVKLKSPDLTVLTGREGIADARAAIAQFQDATPVELSKKYLVLRNLDYYSKEILDTALKLIEEPDEQYQIFATLQSKQGVPGALISRFHEINLPPWGKEQLAMLCSSFEMYAPFSKVLEKATPQSVYELTQFISTTESIAQAWVQASSIDVLTTVVKKSFVRIGEAEAPNMVLTSAIGHAVTLLRQINNPSFQSYFENICHQYVPTLFNNVSRINTSFAVSMEQQVFAFFTATLALRKTLKC